MAFSASTVFEVQGGVGSDTNGGGYVTGSSGTDYSQQASAQIATTDAVAAGTTTITSVTAGFTSAITGNMVYLAGGSNSLGADWYKATYVSATSITVDRNVAAGTGITMNIGGCLNTIGQACTIANAHVADGFIIYVKATGTYSIATALSITNQPGSPVSRVVGYSSTRGDGGQATIQV